MHTLIPSKSFRHLRPDLHLFLRHTRPDPPTTTTSHPPVLGRPPAHSSSYATAHSAARRTRSGDSESLGKSPTITGGNEYLHAQAYGSAVDNQGNADCETGQRGYPLKLNHLDPQGRDLGTDAHTPGNQGPTYAGRARVPAGETYSRNPTTGPQLASTPGNP